MKGWAETLASYVDVVVLLYLHSLDSMLVYGQIQTLPKINLEAGQQTNPILGKIKLKDLTFISSCVETPSTEPLR